MRISASLTKSEKSMVVIISKVQKIISSVRACLPLCSCHGLLVECGTEITSEKLAGTVLERVAWEVVPDLAEALIKEEIRQIKEAAV